MRVLLDENPCDVGAGNVRQAITAAAALVEADGRMIVEVRVDGQTWTGEALDTIADDATADEVRLTSADPIQLICDTFSDAAIALTDADQLQQSAAELLQADQTQAAMEKLNEALSIWSSVQQAVSMGVELAEIDLNKRTPPSKSSRQAVGNSKSGSSAFPSPAVPMANVVDSLNQQLRLVRQALESKDTVALADALLYQLPDVVRQWQGWLSDLQAQIRQR